VAPADNPPRVR